MRLGFGSMTLLLAGLLPTANGCDTIREVLENGERVFSSAEPSTANETKTPPVTVSAPAPAEPDAEPESASTSEPPPAIELANRDSIERFEDETAIPDSERVGTLRDKLTKVQAEPGSGALVAALKPGTAVEKLAQRERFALVSFENPEKASQKLMGWVLTRALAEPIECGPGLTAAYVDDEQTCGILCEADADCPRGDDCSQAASRVSDARDADPIKLCAPREPSGVDVDGPAKPRKDPESKTPAADRVVTQPNTTTEDGPALGNDNGQPGSASQPQPSGTQ